MVLHLILNELWYQFASLAFVRELTGEIPAQTASNAENASIWWRRLVEDDIALQLNVLCLKRQHHKWLWLKGGKFPGVASGKSLPFRPVGWRFH